MKTTFKTILTCLLLACAYIIAFAQSAKVNVIYIGDSITAGAGLGDPSIAPPAIADSDLVKMGLNVTGASNQGHGGYTTLDFLPATDAFKKIETAADGLKGNGGRLVFSIMLGTNDSAIKGPHGSPVSPQDFKSNMKTIIDRLLKDYPESMVIVNRQLWYSPTTYNHSMYLQEGLDRLQSYYPELKELISSYRQSNAGHVFMGDTKAFDYFKNNYQTIFQAEDGQQGTFYLHPNKIGAAALAGFWAKAICKVVSKN